jgi:hypothetical protein
MNVGLCTIVSAKDMGVITYVMQTYELALAQAEENFKGVTEKIIREPETVSEKNGMRYTTFKLPTLYELVLVQEVEIGQAVLPVEEL